MDFIENIIKCHRRSRRGELQYYTPHSEPPHGASTQYVRSHVQPWAGLLFEAREVSLARTAVVSDLVNDSVVHFEAEWC